MVNDPQSATHTQKKTPGHDTSGSGNRHLSWTQERVLFFDIQPAVEHGKFAAKRVIGDQVRVSADLICDGHDKLAGVVRFRRLGEAEFREATLEPELNDRWVGSFVVDELGSWQFTIEAWVDDFASWLWGISRKVNDGQDPRIDFLAGAALVEQAAQRASAGGQATDAKALNEAATSLRRQTDAPERLASVNNEHIQRLMRHYPDRSHASSSDQTFPLLVEVPLARFSAWYEVFPRSLGVNGKHGTFADVERILPDVKDLGFNVLYLPPIHPIGKTHRKGPNNTLHAGPEDPGSPWAIGSEEGGHKEIHPELGTVAQFEQLTRVAREQGIEIAIDIAFQASPDHPYVREHPEWFIHRADGSIQYAENPPKKYQDVYPFDLSGSSSESLWHELLDVFRVWLKRGVRVFRVDNPHTKPIRFWQWCFAEIKAEYPDAIFLAEAFTRPKLMYALAKVGFSQSYTYFTWRTARWELEAYLQELNKPEIREFFSPNFWPNTPDILPEHLQYGGRPMFISRLVLAATLCGNYGVYAPAFELMEHVARPGSEEYIDNEKFQLRNWDLEAEHSLRPIMRLINRIRTENAALKRNDTLVFHNSTNDLVIAYSKRDAATENTILVVVNLDARHRHSAWLDLDFRALGIHEGEAFQVHDLVGDSFFEWSGRRVYVEIDPEAMPCHIFQLRRRQRSELGFEYFA